MSGVGCHQPNERESVRKKPPTAASEAYHFSENELLDAASDQRQHAIEHHCGFAWTRVNHAKSGTEVAQFAENGIYQYAHLYLQVIENKLVAEGGFEPPTKGL